MGLPTGAGGWWTTLTVDTGAASDGWRRVENLHIFPPYNFEDTRADRRPFETYILTFNCEHLNNLTGVMVNFSLLEYYLDQDHCTPLAYPSLDKFIVLAYHNLKGFSEFV